MKTLSLGTALFCGLLMAVESATAQTWTQTSAATNEPWMAMTSSADGSKLLAVAQEAVYTSTNSGVTWTNDWTPLSGNPLQSGASSADGTVLAVCEDFQYIHISTNSGNTWFVSSDAPTNWWESIACSADGSKMVAAASGDAAGNPQPLYVSTNSGMSWTAALVPSNQWAAVASSADGTTLIALVFNGPIYTSLDSGNSWASNNVVAYWRSVACSADGTKAVAVADPSWGAVYTTTNSGVTWTEHTVTGSLGQSVGLDSVASSADGTRLLAVSKQGESGLPPIFVSTDSGNSWIAQGNAAPMADWNAVTCSADGYKMFAATWGLLGNDNAGGIYTLQSTPSPQLNSTFINTNVTISWIVPSTNFVLQQNSDLTTTDWLTLTNTPTLNLSNLADEVVLSPTNSSSFFRLTAQ